MADWRKDVEESLYVQRLLPLHQEDSLEAAFSQKQVLRAMALTAAPVAGPLSPGSIVPTAYGFDLLSPARVPCWPQGVAQDGDYANWGQADACIMRGDADWSGMNRLRFEVCPSQAGAGHIVLNAAVVAASGDAYAREGETIFNLTPGVWQTCCYEFPELDLSNARMIRIYALLNGCDTVMGKELRFRFRQVVLEQVSQPEPCHGWACDRLIVPLAGYMLHGAKTALAPWVEPCEFTVTAIDGTIRHAGKAQKIVNEKGCFALLDFSALTARGDYRLHYGPWEESVSLRDDLPRESLWRSVNFLFGQRCGFPVPGRHSACHLDMMAHHDGMSVSYAGGWHDAGDVSQQTLQTGEVVQVLLEAADSLPTEDPLAQRLVLEAEWGLDFLLRTRFGDGFRATSAGATRWTDNRLGNEDDVAVRVHDHPFENVMLAAIEALAARVLRRFRPALAEGVLPIAEADFRFGIAAFESRGMELPSFFEHSYGSGMSLYHAAIAFAAGQLYLANDDPSLLPLMEEHVGKMVDCQETEGPLPGAFYRDASKTMLMHFNHQSREHLYMDALTLALSIRPEGHAAWEAAARRYADYLKELARYGMPYGMLPAGLHRLDEVEQEDAFCLTHLLVDYQQEKEHYAAQLGAGISLGEGRVVRMFPVWFSFRGNSAVHLSMGRAAARLGTYYHDEALLDIAREQVYWLLGKNPFAQSLQYGMGRRYASQYAVFPGELSGEIPVGIQTRDDEDVPFWPQGCNATYKEVWTSSVSRWVGLLALLMEEKSC